jgi:peptidyl-prolyl cis-trans isomerase-like protein 2
VFTENTHIVAIKATGNVYAYDTIERLNIKVKHWKDLMNDEPFKRRDIIPLQDPNDLSLRNLSKFHHIEKNLKAENGKVKTMHERIIPCIFELIEFLLIYFTNCL